MLLGPEWYPSISYPVLAGAAGALSTLTVPHVSSLLSPRMVSTYKHMCTKDKAEWNSKVGHIVQAVLCVLLVWVSISRTPEFTWTDGPNTKTVRESVLLASNIYSASTFSFSIGYFVADMGMMVAYVPNPVMMLHHIAGVISLVGALLSGCCHFYGLLLLSTEVTTPLICLRWLLDKAQRKGTQLYLVNGVCIVITWILSRILLFIYIFVHMWEHWDIWGTFPLLVRICTPSVALILSCLNVAWFTRIVRGVLLLLKPKPKDAQKDA